MPSSSPHQSDRSSSEVHPRRIPVRLELSGRAAEWLFNASILLCMACLLYPGLVHSEIPAFRDAFHFYYPQAVWLDNCAKQGDYFPRWNPDEGFGGSVAGQVSSALFYPLRLLWILPGVSLPQRYSLVVLIHLVIAALGMRYVSRRMGLGRSAEKLAIASFALSCPIFFQHNNLIYLCSAAWIGFSLGALVDFFSRPAHRLWALAVFSGANSMMLLAGDPHTAINAFIVASLGIAVVLWKTRNWRSTLGLASWIAISCVVFTMLTAVQWIPAVRWSAHSNRRASDLPAVARLDVPEDSSFGSLLKTTASFDLEPHRIYEFSLSPWHVATLLWPTAGGHYTPSNSRWLAALPAEGRMWVPSIYFGLIPCLLFFYGIRGCSRHRWLIYLSLFALLASFGNYSLIWLARELAQALNLQSLTAALPADQGLSVYGLLVAIVPGYDALRYPAKWTVWFAASGSLFAAASFDVIVKCPEKQAIWCPAAVRLLLSVLSISIAAFALLLLLDPVATFFDALSASDPWLGPLSIPAMSRMLLIASMVPLFALTALTWFPSLQSGYVICVTLMEMTIVAASWTAFMEPPTAEQLRDHLPANAFVWVDLNEARYGKDTQADDSPLIRQTQLQKEFLLGKLASIAGVGNLTAVQSVEPLLVEKIKTLVSSRDDFSEHQPELDQFLGMLGVTHRLVSDPMQTSSVRWQKIDDSKPLCELLSVGRDSIGQNNTLHWHWHDRSTLMVETRLQHPGRLFIRQFHDGGWICSTFGDGETSLSLNESPALFLEIHLPAGEHRLTLGRKWLW